jgi:hypothetical protein
MLIKSADNKQSAIATLEALRRRPDATEVQVAAIEKEIKLLRAGIKGEEESAYLINFDFKPSKMTAVIHDLRLEVNGRVAQIDHLLIHRTMTVFVLETKRISSRIKITDQGEFQRWNDFKKTYEGFQSPLAQNERHIEVLKDAFGLIELPTRLGIRLSPTIESYVLISASGCIERPTTFDSSRVIKADVLLSTIEKRWDKEGLLDTLGSVGKFVSMETIEGIARQLCALHRPIEIDYAARFVLREKPLRVDAPQNQAAMPIDASSSSTPEPDEQAIRSGAASAGLACRHCTSDKLSVQYGKFGYYFKCSACDGNTPIKISCGIDGHKERIRKAGQTFYRECPDCKTSSIYFQNSR